MSSRGPDEKAPGGKTIDAKNKTGKKKTTSKEQRIFYLPEEQTKNK